MADESNVLGSVGDAEKIVNSLLYVGGILKSVPPSFSPALEDYEFMQYMQQSLTPTVGNFRILMNMHLYKLKEITVRVLGKKVVEIRAARGMREDKDALMVSTECTYTYDLPQEVIGKELQGELSADGYLHIVATSESFKEDSDEVQVVIEPVDSELKYDLKIQDVKEMVEGIRDRAMDIIRYIRFHTLKIPPALRPEERKQPEILISPNDPSASSEFGINPISDDVKTPSSKEETS